MHIHTLTHFFKVIFVDNKGTSIKQNWLFQSKGRLREFQFVHDSHTYMYTQKHWDIPTDTHRQTDTHTHTHIHTYHHPLTHNSRFHLILPSFFQYSTWTFSAEGFKLATSQVKFASWSPVAAVGAGGFDGSVGMKMLMLFILRGVVTNCFIPWCYCLDILTKYWMVFRK